MHLPEYIEFDLPSGSSYSTDRPAEWIRAHINKDLEHWAAAHQYNYTLERVDNRLKLRFDQISAYTMFVLSWRGKPYRLVEVKDNLAYLNGVHVDWI